MLSLRGDLTYLVIVIGSLQIQLNVFANISINAFERIFELEAANNSEATSKISCYLIRKEIQSATFLKTEPECLYTSNLAPLDQSYGF